MNESMSIVTPEALREWFSRQETDEASRSQWGGVIDRLPEEDMRPLLREYASVVRFRPLFYNTPYAHLLEGSPFLFELSSESGPFLACLHALPRPWGFLWEGAASPQQTQKHWQSLLTAELPTRQLTHFRFYSPAVFAGMADACTAKELSWLLGPLAHALVPMRHTRLPEKAERENDWLCVKKPLLEARSAQAIAEEYQPIGSPWWQVTDAHLHAFADVLDNVYQDNLELRLWENYPVQAREIDAQYGSVRNFIAASLREARACGFHTPQQQYRFMLLGVHYDFRTASCPQARNIEDLARLNPEKALDQLEEMLRNPHYE